MRDIFGKEIKGNFFNTSLGTSSKTKRTLGERDKTILYKRAKGKCENCQKKITYSGMQAGHKKAASKGGNATLGNSVCVCYECNKEQGTDSWVTFRKKQGKSKTTTVTSVKKKTPTKKKTKRKSTNNLFGIPEIKIKPHKIKLF